MPFRIPFAGEGEFFTPDSVLSHCYGALLPMFTTKEATTLRQLCREFKTTVADFPWEDEKTVIRGSVAAWRACYPRARSANVMEAPENGYNHDDDPPSHWTRLGRCSQGRFSPLNDVDFVHFVGLRRLKMSHSTNVTDAAFVHLKGIHTLDMSYCSLSNITDAAFVHLKGIHTLGMGHCFQSTITDAAFVHLKGIHTLDMSTCSQTTITDATCAHLKGIHSLSLWGCRQLTSAVFIHLKGVKRLDIGGCPQLNLTDDSLKGIEWLGMYGRSQEQIEQAKTLGYPVDQRVHSGV